METVIHIALTPDPQAKVTPLEVLEDFADASRSWHYLEEESQHYGAEKDVPAGVLRHQRSDGPRYVDFAFASTDPGHLSDLELVLLDAPTPEAQLGLKERNAVIDAFLRDLRAYLHARPDHVTLRVDKEDIDAAKLPE